MATYALTVSNKVGSYDGDMVVKNYTTLTVGAGNTLTTEQACRGLFIYVQGDCTINGTLSMTARGAAVDPTVAGASDNLAVNSTGLRYGVSYTGGTDSLTMSTSEFNGCGTNIKSAIANVLSGSGTNYKVVSIPRTGAAATATAADPTLYRDGNNGANGQTGSGGSGQAAPAGGGGGTAGYGGAGTCFSGGAGGGGTRSSTGGNGSNTGGSGGAASVSCGACGAGGGAGNPGGSGQNFSSSGAAGGTGTGGLLFLVVGGNLTIGSGGTIESKGVAGGAAQGNCGSYPNEQAAGGGSGGGSIVILYRGTYTNNGTVSVAGGAGGLSCSYRGGNGGTGSTQIYKIL